MLLPGFPIGSGGIGGAFISSKHMIYDPAMGRLYAVNDGDHTLSVFSVNRTTGALTPLPFSPVAPDGS